MNITHEQIGMQDGIRWLCDMERGHKRLNSAAYWRGVLRAYRRFDHDDFPCAIQRVIKQIQSPVRLLPRPTPAIAEKPANDAAERVLFRYDGRTKLYTGTRETVGSLRVLRYTDTRGNEHCVVEDERVAIIDEMITQEAKAA